MWILTVLYVDDVSESFTFHSGMDATVRARCYSTKPHVRFVSLTFYQNSEPPQVQEIPF
jgi:hypothetical protein